MSIRGLGFAPRVTTESTAVPRCWPLAAAAKSSGDALLVRARQLSAVGTALPAPPPPAPGASVLFTLQSNPRTSISCGWAASALSPAMASILRKKLSAAGPVGGASPAPRPSAAGLDDAMGISFPRLGVAQGTPAGLLRE